VAESMIRQSGKQVRLGPYPELTWTGVLVGYGIGVLLAISMAYASLILGFSIEGSELAAILGFGVLRGLLRRRSIVENNVNQSLASSVNAAQAGIVFTLPALFILKYEFSKPMVILGAIVGGIMGVAFIIPLRKQMIDFERLAYPGGIAVATILKSPGAGIHKAKLMIGGLLFSGLVHLVVNVFQYFDAPVGDWIGMPGYMNGVWYLSLMTVGVGFLSGRGGVFFIIGGFICYWLLAPLMAGFDLFPAAVMANGAIDPGALRIELFRPVGIGMLIGGAIVGVVLALPMVVGAVRSMQDAAKGGGSAVARDELPIKLLYFGVAGAFVVLLVVGVNSSPSMTIGRGILMAVLGTLWIWMAGVILSECIGRTNWSPLSGMTLIGVTLLILVVQNDNAVHTIVAAVTVGVAMCVAMSQATDLMLDLKTGYLVGATPKKQQIAQFLGTWLGPIIVVGLLFVLNAQSPLGGERFPAAQGQALASVLTGITGGDVPTAKYIAGAGLGAMLSASGIGGLGILVGLGFYLPFNIVLTYSIGTALRVSCDRFRGRQWSEETGIPIAAGLIVGEALVGVGYAVFQIISGGSGGGH
jgi:putative OPT family oligopeptide transporter